jgi:hypothetical protein
MQPSPFRLGLTSLVLSAVGLLRAVEIEPWTIGPCPVGSTHFEVAVPEQINLFDYLNGKGSGKNGRYITDLFVHPQEVPTCYVAIPANSRLYGGYAGQRLPIALYVLYPTIGDNDRPDYAFPYRETGDNVFPRMQRAGEKPLVAPASTKRPLIVYSGGYNTHGLWHLEHLKVLASHGYVVVDLFHGDGRSNSFIANLAVRSLALKTAIDFLLADPDFSAVIDPDRIGVSGASGGGHTVLGALGGIDPGAANPAAADPRIRAGFGLLPFVGREFGFFTNGWVFGKDYVGLRPVQAPFMAVYGEADVSVSPTTVEAAVRAVSGPVYAVLLERETHSLTPATNSDVHTWELLFFDAWLRDNPDSRQLLARATSVRGGVSDRRTYFRNPR